MSTEAWAIIGVVVGALATGGISLLNTFLQRRWSAEEAERAWDREKRDRLFEAKRTAHSTFTDVLRRTQTILDEDFRHDGSREDEVRATSVELIHQHAHLQIYASPEASRAAMTAASVLLDLATEWDHAKEGDYDEGDYPAAPVDLGIAIGEYVALLRVDLGIDLEIDADHRMT